MKIRVYKVSIPDGNGFLAIRSMNEFEDCLGGILDDEVGNKYTVEIAEMDEQEFGNLPEFDGF
jgi:hypothetical protein